MTNQSNEAAERSAHVTRGDKPTPAEWPVVQLADGSWKLKAIVELEEERDKWKSLALGIAAQMYAKFGTERPPILPMIFESERKKLGIHDDNTPPPPSP